MTHRQRVSEALNHRTPDRCPMQISFTPEFAERLRKELNLKNDSVHNPHGGGNRYDLELALDEDMLLTSVGWANSYYMEGDYYTDEWGVGWKSVWYETKYGRGRYTEPDGHPLSEDGAIKSYTPPDPDRDEIYRESERVVKMYGDEYWIVGVVVTTIFECAWALRGFERLLMDFVENPDLADEILEIPYRYHLTAAKRLVEIGVDMIWTGDDMGSQNSMIISPALWRKFFKLRMKNFFSELKRINPDIKITYHSDGYIDPIIPDLIEIGLDVLNPVQPPCVDLQKVKKSYGDRLCFWGSIDEQYTLPFASPDEVYRTVRHNIQALGENGGFIAGPTHHVQLDTPMENFWVMVRAIKEPYPV